jgi:hypothetical protein
VLEAVEEHRFSLGHLLLAIPQQLNIEIHHAVLRWQTPQQTLLDIGPHQMQSVRPPPIITGTDAAPVMMGSHLDTQPEGGRFDGVYGVLAGLEVVRCLNDQKIKNRKPLEVAVWTNEEGARFTPAMFGSAVFTGIMDLDAAHAGTTPMPLRKKRVVRRGADDPGD